MKIDDVLAEVKKELEAATKKFGPIISPHEGIAVIEEEFIEMRNAVFWPEVAENASFKEAIQLAAMAVRFIIDLNEEKDLRCQYTKSGQHEIRDVDTWGEPHPPWCAQCGLTFEEEDEDSSSS